MLSEGTTDFLDAELTKLESDFRSKINTFLNSNLSQVDLVTLMAEIDFFKELQDAGLSDIINKVESEYVGILDKVIKDARNLGVSISGLNLDALDTIMGLDADNILNSAKNYSNQFKAEIIKGALTGLTTNEIVASLDNIPLKTNQLVAAVNTAKDEFQAASMAKVFEDDETVRFKLAGPVDNRTRCVCLGVMEFQSDSGYTRKEIDEGAWSKLAEKGCEEFGRSPSQREYLTKYLGGNYSFVKRGGFNCRHFIQIAE